MLHILKIYIYLNSVTAIMAIEKKKSISTRNIAVLKYKGQKTKFWVPWKPQSRMQF